MSNWIKEISAKLKCNNNSLEFYCNSRESILEIAIDNSRTRLRIFTKDYRLSYSNDRLFDFHNLMIRKGDDAKRFLLEMLERIKEGIKEDLEEMRIRYDIPVRLIQDFIDKFNLERFEIRGLLDFDVKYVEYDLGREFIKDDPRLNSEMRLKIILLINDKCLGITNWLDSQKSNVYVSDNCEKWFENISEFKKLISNYYTLDARYEEIKRYINNLVKEYK